MTTDPALAYAGPESRSIDVTVILYDGAAIISRGVIGNFDTSAGEASAPFADAGPLAWIAYDDDPAQGPQRVALGAWRNWWRPDASVRRSNHEHPLNRNLPQRLPPKAPTMSVLLTVPPMCSC